MAITRRVGAGLVVAALAVPLGAGPASATSGAHGGGAAHRGGRGAPGVGDNYFPAAGNGGYDVRHYGLDIRYEPASRAFSGVAAISASATQRPSRFNLDPRGSEVRSVTVDGRPARFDRSGQELRVSPGRGLPPGERFPVVVRCDGTTGRPTDVEGALYGWVSTPDGSFVANEPDGATTWFSPGGGWTCSSRPGVTPRASRRPGSPGDHDRRFARRPAGLLNRLRSSMHRPTLIRAAQGVGWELSGCSYQPLTSPPVMGPFLR